MPNHVHGILEITNEGGGTHVGAENFLPSVFLPSVVNLPLANNLPLADINQLPLADNTHPPRAGNTERAEGFLPLPPPQPSFQHVIPRSIPSIVRGFKIGVSKWYREQFGAQERSIWQRNYYEHIIRDEEARQRISEYIESNPALWLQDRFYSS